MRISLLRVGRKPLLYLCASVPQCVVLLLLAVAPLWAQTATTSQTRTHVQTLASERFAGREAGTDGERLAFLDVVKRGYCDGCGRKLAQHDVCHCQNDE